MNKRRALLVVAIVVAIGVALFVRFGIGERTAPPSPVDFVATTWTDARETPMHRAHVGTKKIACTECHADQDSAPPRDVCTKCHDLESKVTHRGGKAETTSCLTCHVFGKDKAASTCSGCHAKTSRAVGVPALEHHATAGMACEGCHAVHDKSRAVAECTDCHTSKSARHGRESVAGPVDRDRDAAADPARDASALLEAATTWRRRRDAGEGHAGTAMCTSCHQPHAGKLDAESQCATCHVRGEASDPRLASLAREAPRVALRGPNIAGHAACVTCHAPHRAERDEVKSCVGCHGDHRAALVASSHPTCTGCHAPHAPTEARGACTTCHAAVNTLASTRAPAHADCASCHDPHRPERAPGLACEGCHATVKPSHPVAASVTRGACIGCHEPHPKTKTAASATSCTSCHGKPDRAPMAGALANGDRSLHAGGVACTECHAPHAFRLAGAGAALCASCHGAKAKLVTERRGHADCASCHGAPHAPKPKPGCDGCHAAEVASTTKGHERCTSCHDPHSGALGAAASCTSCHTNKRPASPGFANAALHTTLPGGCATCHRAHGPGGQATPPTCASCHASPTSAASSPRPAGPSLSGLHGVGAHGSCASCHHGHAPARSDRPTCTTGCHVDRRTHQPEAQVCNGCHLFRAPR